MNVKFSEMQATFERVLRKYGFGAGKAETCATIFAQNSLDGVYSHGLNRFPVFIEYVQEGLVDPAAEPEVISRLGTIEQWDGNLGAGMYNAFKAMERAILLAKEFGTGVIALRNTNHWMRGGTYGWQAVNAGVTCLCMTNTIANMPAWGGREARVGNNPLVVGVPAANMPVVLDMAMSQYSYGKLQEYELRGEQLPYSGGYDEAGMLTKDPAAIRQTKRVLPAGLWKGSGLSMAIDLLVTVLSSGRSTAKITKSGKEYGLSQLFICISTAEPEKSSIEEMISFLKTDDEGRFDPHVRYPGERTLQIRAKNMDEGIPVNERIWQQVLQM